MKTRLSISPEDLIRILSGYIGQKYAGQIKFKAPDVKFMITTNDGISVTSFSSGTTPRLSEIVIEYDDINKQD